MLLLSRAGLLLVVAAISAARESSSAYLSHKGKSYDIEGFDATGRSYTSLTKAQIFSGEYNAEKHDAGVVAGGRVMSNSKSPITTSVVDPTESGDWENYWPSFFEGGSRMHHEKGTVRNKNGRIIDKVWYHLSNRPAPTVTETQTQFEFTQIYITSSVEPTESYWCDGGWIQITKTGDLMDDEWVVSYITGYLMIIGANVDDVDTYDWCVNTQDRNNTGACARQFAQSQSEADLDAAFSVASGDQTSTIVLHVCSLPCLDAICVATQVNYSKLQPLRLTEITFTKRSDGSRNVTTPCVDGEGIYAPGAGNGGKTFKFCPKGQLCVEQPGDSTCECILCPEPVPNCLVNVCPMFQEATNITAAPSWFFTRSCLPGACEIGFYRNMETEMCSACPVVFGCQQSVCTSPTDAKCAYGGCSDGCTSTATPGGGGTCQCDPQILTTPYIYAKNGLNTGWVTPLDIGGSDVTIQVDTGSEDLVVVSTLCTSDFCKQFPPYDPTPSGTNTGLSGEISYGQTGAETWFFDIYKDSVVVGQSGIKLTSVPLGAVTELVDANVIGSGILGVGPVYGPGESVIQGILPGARSFIQSLVAGGKIAEPVYTIHFGEVVSTNMSDVPYAPFYNNATDGSVDWGAFALIKGMIEVETVCDNYITPLVAFDLCRPVGSDICGNKISIPIPPQANSASLTTSEECVSNTPLIDSGTANLQLPASMYDLLLLDFLYVFGDIMGLSNDEVDTIIKNTPDKELLPLLEAINTKPILLQDDMVAAAPTIIMTFTHGAKLVASPLDIVQSGFSCACGGTFIIGDTVSFGDTISFHTTEKKMAFKGQ